MARINSGHILGFAMGGFFDGILLHQVLQWHHLLSNVEGADPRVQIAADGYFHVLMYVIAAVGLWRLWRERETLTGRALIVAMLVGFGVWNLVDNIVFHWVLGIHRIRVDQSSPLFWDLLWFMVFGLIPLALAWVVARGRALPPRSAVAPCIAAALVIGSGVLAARQPPATPYATVLFAPGTDRAAAFMSVVRAGGRPVWSDASGQLLVFEDSAVTRPASLYRSGAILVSGGSLPAGCIDWVRI